MIPLLQLKQNGTATQQVNHSRTHQAIQVERNRKFKTQQQEENKTETTIELEQQFEYTTVVK